MEIEYSPEDYKVIKTEEMDKELVFKLVEFTTGYYGVISYNPTTDNEQVILLSPEKDVAGNHEYLFGGLGCKSFMVFAHDAKQYMENAPIELVVQLGHDAADEYRELITKDQAHTLYEKMEICHELLSMKIEDSFHYKYGDPILTGLLCFNIIIAIILILNSFHILGGV